MARHWHPKSCYRCGANVADGFHISATGLCDDCGDFHVLENIRQLRSGEGYFFSNWHRKLLRSLTVAEDRSER